MSALTKDDWESPWATLWCGLFVAPHTEHLRDAPALKDAHVAVAFVPAKRVILVSSALLRLASYHQVRNDQCNNTAGSFCGKS